MSMSGPSRSRSKSMFNPLSVQMNPECVPRLSLKMCNGLMSIANMIIFLIKLNSMYM